MARHLENTDMVNLQYTVWSNPFYRFKNLPVNNQYSFLYLSRPGLTFFYISLDTVGSLAEESTRCPIIGCSYRRGRGKNLHVIPGSRPHPLLVRHHFTWGSIPTMKSRNRNYKISVMIRRREARQRLLGHWEVSKLRNLQLMRKSR